MALNPKLYRIDTEHRLLAPLSRSVDIIGKIIKTSSEKLGIKTQFRTDSLKQISRDEVTYFLHLFNSNEIVSDWKEFLPAQLTEDEDFTQQKLSLILFVETDQNLFAAIGGSAYQFIVPFIDHSFGLELYSRIMSPNEDSLVSIKYRGITGARAASNEQFRDDYRIIDFIRFGKIPQEIHIKLSKAISDLHFPFLKARPGDRVQIHVGKGLKIKKSVDFGTLHKIVLELGHIVQLVPSDYLSSYEEIKDKNYIANFLNPELIRRLYEDQGYIDKGQFDSNQRFQFDFCNPNSIEQFYEADQYKLKEKTDNGGYSVFKIVEERQSIYQSVLERAIERFGTNDRFNFQVFLQGVRVSAYKGNSKPLSSNFLFHVSTEFPIQGKPVFLVDTKWYHLRDSFVIDLKSSATHVLKTYEAQKGILDLPWNKANLSKEGDYSMQYDKRQTYIVVDTIITDGLELCDIMHFDGDNLYLIHVKYGFSSKMRELTNQILISARRLREALSTKSKSVLKKVYGKLKSKNRDVDGLSEAEFINLFEKRITYILAFTSHLGQDLEVKDNIDKFDSNIARFSLVQCSGEMRAQYYNLETCQIRRK